MSTYAEKYPHPGEAPPRSSEEPPAYQSPERTEWEKVSRAYNTWAHKTRAHHVAKALDRLLHETSNAKPVLMTPVQTIAFVLATAYLDGTIDVNRPVSILDMFGLS
jgi:hypothetical protein